MKLTISLCFLFVSCGLIQPVVSNVTVYDTTHLTVVVYDTTHLTVVVYDTTLNKVVVNDTISGLINAKAFGAIGDGFHDDYPALQAASDYIIQNPGAGANLYLPPGNYYISHPWILQRVVNGQWAYFNIHIFGDAPAKESPAAYLSTIICGFTDGFAIGMQFGRGIKIENLSIVGKYSFPGSISNLSIGSTLYSAWGTDMSRYAPYCGICIDPFCDSNQLASASRYQALNAFYLPGTGRGGTSGVEIRQCAVHNFPVGVMLSPNPYTQNDEMVNLIDDNIDLVKIAIAIGQDQSKEIHIDRLKCWASTYTILDGLHYGLGTGGGSVMINGMNIAGNVNQLFYLNANRFPLSVSNVYAESIFRIGTVGGNAGTSFINCQVDLLGGAGIPAPDYILSGTGTWIGGMLRYYDGSYTHRANLSNIKFTFRDMTMSNYPITQTLYNLGGTTKYPAIMLDNVTMYYTTPNSENMQLIAGNIPVTVDRVKWTASFTPVKTDSISVGDYILAAPRSTDGNYFDNALNPAASLTRQIGRVTSISGGIVYMDNVGVNINSTDGYDAIYVDKIK